MSRLNLMWLSAELKAAICIISISFPLHKLFFFKLHTPFVCSIFGASLLMKPAARLIEFNRWLQPSTRYLWVARDVHRNKLYRAHIRSHSSHTESHTESKPPSTPGRFHTPMVNKLWMERSSNDLLSPTPNELSPSASQQSIKYQVTPATFKLLEKISDCRFIFS